MDYNGNRSAVANEWYTIFDISDPVDIMSGVISDYGLRRIRVAFEDGSDLEVIDNEYVNGEDEVGDGSGFAMIPYCTNVTKLEFYSGVDGAFGYRVTTI